MIKPLVAAGLAAAFLTTPILVQAASAAPQKMMRPTARPAMPAQYIPGRPGIRPNHGAGYIPGGPGIYRPTHGAGYIPGGPGIYRPTHGAGYIPGGPGIYRPRMTRPTYALPAQTFAGGYGYRRGYVGTGYSGYGGYGAESYGGGSISGYGYGNSYGSGYGPTVSVPSKVGYDVGTALGTVGYATVGHGGGYGYGAYPAAQPNAVVTTAYVPVLTYRPIKVIYTPQTPPYYNTPPHYVAY